MSKKSVVLFDLDHTLYEYESVHKKSLKNVYEVLSAEEDISFDEFNNLYKTSQAEVKSELLATASSNNRVLYFHKLVEKLDKTLNPDKILKLYNAYWDYFLENMRLGDGVLETLKELKNRGIKTAIISNLTTHIQLRKISKLGISDYIDVLVTSEEVGREKPSSIMFLYALKKLNASSSDAIMVGDSIKKDIEGGNLVGLETVFLAYDDNNEFNFDLEYKNPNHIIKQIPEILKLI